MRRRATIVTLGLILGAVASCSQQAAAPSPTTGSSGSAPTTASQTPTAPSQSRATPAAAAAPATNPAERINGTIQSVANGKVTLDDGKSFTVDDKTRIIRIEPATPGDLMAGDFVAVTAKRQPDNTLLASMINVFPASMKGVGVGQRPMQGGNLMTNATIDKIDSSGFTVTFPGGGARVTLASNCQISKLIDGSLSDLKAGEMVSALVDQGIARSITVR